MKGVIKQEAYEEFFKAFEDTKLTGEGYLRMEMIKEGVIEIKHVHVKEIEIRIQLGH